MTSQVRLMAGALDEAALEALASKGLVRRATADVAAGKAVIESETDVEARVRVEDAVATLLAAGPRQGGCSCPAPGVCRHRLSALILLARPTEASAEADAPAPPPEADWGEVVATFDEASLSRFLGKAAWRGLLADPSAVGGAEVLQQPGVLQVRLAGWPDPVRFLPVGGLEAAFTRAAEKDRKRQVTLAALAAREALGLPAFTAEAPSAAPVTLAEVGIDPATLRGVRDALARCYLAALAFTPRTLEEELRRLALAGRVEAAPRLSALLRRLAGGFEPLRLRNVEADPEGLLALMAEAYALAVALGGEDETGRLAGKVRQAYEPIGDLVLHGLGARLWETAAGGHGVTLHFYAPEQNRAFTLTQARADRSDPTFEPARAFQDASIWGQRLRDLAWGRVALNGALASDTGRLSTSAQTTARLEDSTRGPASGWPLIADDWAVLESRLRRDHGPGLTPPPVADAPVILKPTRRGGLQFDERTQTLIWPVADTVGRWIALELEQDDRQEGRIDVLERLAAGGAIEAVYAQVEQTDGRFRLTPYAVWTDRLRLLDTALDPDPRRRFGARTPAPTTRLFARLRAQVAARGEPTGLISSRAGTDVLLQDAWELLLRRAEMGRAVDRVAFVAESGALAARFAAAGLTPLSAAFSFPTSQAADEAACLRAVWGVVSARALRARLAWMV